MLQLKRRINAIHHPEEVILTQRELFNDYLKILETVRKYKATFWCLDPNQNP